MASSIVKGVTVIVTPGKTPKVNPVASLFKKKSLSAISTKFVQFSSPHLGSYNSNSCDTTKGRNLLLPDKSFRSQSQRSAVRCLFSPQRQKTITHTKGSSPRGNVHCLNRTVPSFDTPLRNAFSFNKFIENGKGFVLGRGSFGYVVQGTYKNKNIAVKVISECQNQDEMFKSEMNALSLKHPNIVQVFQVTKVPDKNIGFVFMELYSNTNLEKILQCGPVPLSMKSKYLMQIGSALEYCHNNSVLHLDVKPKNIIVNSIEETCKLCDFGSSINKSDLNKSVIAMKGTLKYSAPELLRGECPTEKADVFAFGITMWQIINQKVPYDKEDLQEVVYKVVKQNYRPASRETLHHSAGHDIYESCWQAEPTQRPSMSHVLTMLEKKRLWETEKNT